MCVVRVQHPRWQGGKGSVSSTPFIRQGAARLDPCFILASTLELGGTCEGKGRTAPSTMSGPRATGPTLTTRQRLPLLAARDNGEPPRLNGHPCSKQVGERVAGLGPQHAFSFIIADAGCWIRVQLNILKQVASEERIHKSQQAGVRGLGWQAALAGSNMGGLLTCLLDALPNVPVDEGTLRVQPERGDVVERQEREAGDKERRGLELMHILQNPQLAPPHLAS